MLGTQPAPMLGRSDERRKHARIDVRKDLIEVELIPPEGVAIMLDVSESGMGLQTQSALQMGSTRRFHFQIPGQPAVVGLSGIVVSSTATRVGISITSIEEPSQAHFREWLCISATATGNREQSAQSQLDVLWPVIADDALEAAMKKTQDAADSTGIAIAWRDSEGMICRCSTGLAPNPGVRVHLDGGLSGECVRSRSVVHCRDAETDSRVDPEVCRRLDLRSLVIIPILCPSGVTGVLEVFSNKAGGFGDANIEALRDIAATLGTVPPHDHTANLAPEQHQVERQITPLPFANWDPKPSRAGYGLAAARAAQAISIRAQAVPIAIRAPGTGSTATRSRSAETWPRVVLAHLRRHRAQSGLGVIVALVLTAGAIVILGSRNSVTGPDRAARPAGGGAATAPAPSLSSAAAMGSIPRRTGSKTSRRTEQKLGRPTTESAPTASNMGEGTHLPKIPTGTEIQRNAIDTTVAPPTLAGNGATDQHLLNTLAVPVPDPPVLDTPTSSGVSPAKVIRRVSPTYPPAALALRREGDVVLDVTVGENGEVKDVRVAQGSPDFAKAAVEAVRAWRYDPYRLNGKPTEITTRVILRFRLPGHE